jgi:hypothetical protein
MMSVSTALGTVAEADLRSDLGRVCTAVRKVFGERLFSIVAAGSLGRLHAEGVITTRQHVEDYDLIIITSSASDVLRLFHRRLMRQWLGEESRTFAVPVSMGILKLAELQILPFTLFNYELRHVSQVLFGKDPVPEMPAYQSNGMPLIEATRLLLNRGVLLWGDLTRLDDGEPPENELQNIALRRRKVVLGIGDALLISARSFHWAYQRRIEGAPRCAVFDRLGLGDFRSRYVEALVERLIGQVTPALSRQELREDLRQLLSIHEAAFRYVEACRLGYPCTDWAQYSEANLLYPRYLGRSYARRLVHLRKGFGLPRGSGFYRAQLGRTAEEVLLRAFPRLAYESDMTQATLRRFLNWPAERLPSRLSVSRCFHDVWARNGRACA